MIASVIIPTYNRIHQLINLLSSLNKQTTMNFEVVVIDDFSIKPVEPEINALDYAFRIKVLRNKRNMGPGASRNIGIQIAKSEIILFTDDDCILDPNWVLCISEKLKMSSNKTAGIGGCTVSAKSSLISRYYDFHRILDPKPHDKDNPNRIPYLVTANCAMKKDIIFKAGGFDSRIPQAGGEDTALSIRIIKQGFHFLREPNAIVYHCYRETLKEFRETFYRYGLGARFVVDNYIPL